GAGGLVGLAVVGPAGASILIACMLGHRFTGLAVLESVVPSMRRLAHRAGVSEKLAPVRAVDIPVLDLAKNRERSISRMIELGRRAGEEDGADTLALGCMSMGFLEAQQTIAAEVGVPVVNPVYAALKILEALVGAGLAHSKRAYPIPPKMA